MLQAQIDVIELSSSLRRLEISPGALSKIVELMLAQRREAKACDFVVDYPILSGGVLRRLKKLRPVLALRGLKMIPGVLGFDHVRISIDDSRAYSHRHSPFSSPRCGLMELSVDSNERVK
jgi:hypothetical protein